MGNRSRYDCPHWYRGNHAVCMLVCDIIHRQTNTLNHSLFPGGYCIIEIVLIINQPSHIYVGLFFS